MSVVFFFDASVSVGLGHLYRCKSLAELFIEKGWEVIFYCQELDNSLSPLLGMGTIVRYPSNEEIDNYCDLHQHSVIILDLNKSLKFKSIDGLSTFIRRIKSLTSALVANFDDYEWEATPADVTIIPYPKVPVENRDIPSGQHFLFGLKYMFFRAPFYENRVRINPKMKRILIFMGGTDLHGLSIRMLNCIQESSIEFERIKVITGTNSQLISEDFKSFHHLNVEFIKGVEDVAKHYLDVDLALVNSGLVKYEAAFLGLPLITVSNDRSHEWIMQKFQEITGNKHLGVWNAVHCDLVVQSIEEYDFTQRKEVSNRSRELFNENRFALLDELIKLSK